MRFFGDNEFGQEVFLSFFMWNRRLTVFLKCRITTAVSDVHDSLEKIKDLKKFCCNQKKNSIYQTRAKSRRAPFLVDVTSVRNEVELFWNQNRIKRNRK